MTPLQEKFLLVLVWLIDLIGFIINLIFFYFVLEYLGGNFGLAFVLAYIYKEIKEVK